MQLILSIIIKQGFEPRILSVCHKHCHHCLYNDIHYLVYQKSSSSSSSRSPCLKTSSRRSSIPSRMSLGLSLSPLSVAAASARFLSCNWKRNSGLAYQMDYRDTYEQDSVFHSVVDLKFEYIYIACLSETMRSIESLILKREKYQPRAEHHGIHFCKPQELGSTTNPPR